MHWIAKASHNPFQAMSSKVQFQKLSDKATLPKRAHEGDAGYDIFSAVNTVVPARSNKLIKTNICVRLPTPPVEGTSVYGRVAERSGLALRNNIKIGGGVIDSNYTGDIGVIMCNPSDAEFEVTRGDRIAQLVLTICLTPDVEEVDDISVAFTARGAHGLGSTGIR